MTAVFRPVVITVNLPKDINTILTEAAVSQGITKNELTYRILETWANEILRFKNVMSLTSPVKPDIVG